MTIIDSIVRFLGGMERDTTRPACRLDATGLRAQLERYRKVSAHTSAIERGPQRVVARFDAELPAGTLERAIEIERGCCAFIDAEYDRAARRLALTVRDPVHDPVLDALFDALRPAG